MFSAPFRLFARSYSSSTAARTVTNLNELGKFLPKHVAAFVKEKAELCQAKDVYVCDGTENEYQTILHDLQSKGLITQLRKYENCWLVRTDPADVARVESKTFVASKNKRDTIPETAEGVPSQMGNWFSVEDLHKAWNERFPGCMNGRTMYVIPFSMGPIGSPLAKIGIELTDSPYVVACMRVMTRMGSKVTETLGDGEFVKCLHSIGQPLPMKTPPVQGWPCNPEKTIITHLPETNEIASFGSGYGGNSLLGKKCLALRLGSVIAKREGWLAEHCMIVGITAPNGTKRYVVAAFPSACGKTNLAMLVPTLPGYKIETVGDDIAWMRFDSEGRLRAINPEAGFFGVAPGTSHKTNTLAIHTIERNTLFTNTAETADGGFYWEGLEHELPDHMEVIDWKGKHWDRHGKEPAAHPNSRFCTPIEQLPILDRAAWQGSEGVPIDAIIFGGRRPEGVPLVYEAFDWEHGVFVGANMRSESTAAAEHKAKVIMHDPFAMRPFFGYNFGEYIGHWLSMPRQNPHAKMPKIFHVNWFRRTPDGGFLWPGFSENCRVLDWIMRRVDGEENIAQKSAVGWLPKQESFRLEGLDPDEPIDWDALFSVPKDFWIQEAEELGKYFQEQVGKDLPDEMWRQRDLLLQRLHEV